MLTKEDLQDIHDFLFEIGYNKQRRQRTLLDKIELEMEGMKDV